MNDERETVGLVAQLVGLFVAGGVGAVSRVLLSELVDASWSERLPFSGTLVVNLLGCLLIGVGSVAIGPAHWRTIVLAGLLGGFTTYSAFALLSVTLADNQRLAILGVQVTAHVIGGFVCVWAGSALARGLGLGE